MADRLTVAVVGGGWAGLAAAVTLAEAGQRVALFESARQLGGRARRIEWHGLALDNGQHLMAGAYRETLAMMARLGTLDLIDRRPLDLRAPGFRLALPRLPAPFHLAVGFLGAAGLSLNEKLAAVRFMQALKRSRFKLKHDTTAQALLDLHRQPRAAVDKLWEPICVAALNTPLALASAQVFCNVLRDSLAGPRDASDMLFNVADMGRLVPDAAARFIIERGGEIQLSSRVEGLHREEDCFHLSGPGLLADRVVLATHPARIPGLLTDIEAAHGVVRQIRLFSWQPILTAWLYFASPVRLPYPMLALGHGNAPWAFDRSGLAPGLVSIVASAEGPHLIQPAEQLRDQYLARLSAIVGPLPPLLDSTTIVEKRATFACIPGLDRPGNLTPVPGLYLAGDYTAGDYPATLEGAVRSGVKCARLILERT